MRKRFSEQSVRAIYACYCRDFYLFLDKDCGYRSDTWCEGRSSICLHSQAQGCHTLSWPAELLHHNFGSSLHMDPTSPTGHPPETKKDQVFSSFKCINDSYKNDRHWFFNSHRNVHGAVLISAGSLVAHLAVATAGAVCPGKVSSLANQLSVGFPGAPQFGTGLHVWTGLGANTES